MHVFVNGRLIQHRTLNFVIEECFHTLLMVGRHPVVMIRIEVDPELVDVNVHPTKAEVRFPDERAVCRAVQRAVHAALAGAPTEELPRVVVFDPGRSTDPVVQPALMAAPARNPEPAEEADDEPRRHVAGRSRCCGFWVRSVPRTSSPKVRRVST